MKEKLKELENILTKLKLKASNLKRENKNLKFKVVLLIISLGLITWLIFLTMHPFGRIVFDEKILLTMKAVN